MEEEREPEAKRLKEGGVITTEGAGGDDNDDDVWSNMKTVRDKSSSKRKLCAGLYLKHPIQWNPFYSGHAPLGNEILSFIEGWPYLRGCIWDSAKWP